MYYFYINFPSFNDRIIKIHLAECSRCNHGKGQNGDEFSNEKGFWVGPFDKYPNTVSALEKLTSKFKSTVKFEDCKFCNPKN